MLSFLPAARLKRIDEARRDDSDLSRLGADWSSVQRYFSRIRQTGHHESNEEIDDGVVGIAAPILVDRVGPVGVISLVFSVDRLPLLNPNGLASMLKARNAEIASRLGVLSEVSGGAAQEPETSNADR